MNFASDNTAGASPAIVAALAAAAGAGRAMPYGNDDLSRGVERRLAELFETEVAVFPVATGTAANSLALAAMTPPHGAIYCHADSHIQQDECGAPEMFTGGAKLVPLAGAGGKIAAGDLERALAKAGIGVVHHVQPAALSLTQATEAGTVYRPDEVAALADIAHRHAMGVHMDGARFANALVSLNAAPADLTWRAGVDALSFGATKNGAFAAEAVLLFKPDLARAFAFRRKRAGHLFSKMRFLTAQLDAYLADDHWLANARHANAMARRLADGLGAIGGLALVHPVEANELFVTMPDPTIEGLMKAGFQFYRWDGQVCRLVTAFDTQAAHVDAFVEHARRLTA